ncbi:hypothetical protein QYE76_060292 [Lolium multiflorum]|uniref:RNase H type-1 domain-containing protein n=1 Tax=Lolium multiflorum TaxID=4521 RepID=A0AAD8RYY2_LOLMU|nr:hypothetical protein QYE76_060292 [Lolium multiflorum]
MTKAAEILKKKNEEIDIDYVRKLVASAGYQSKADTSRRNECETSTTPLPCTFIGGLQRGGLLRHKLTCLANANKLTLDEMISIASDHTAADDDAGGDIAATAIPLHQQKKNRDNGNSGSQKRKNPDDQEWRIRLGRHGVPTRRFREAEEDAAVEASRQGSAKHGTEATVADPAPRKPTRSIGTCPGPSGSGYEEVHSHQPQLQVGQRLKERPGGRIQASPAPPRGKGGKGKNKDKDEDSSRQWMRMITRRIPRQGPQSSYHVIFGRPTYHKFHARACYIYNKLKIPGPKEYEALLHELCIAKEIGIKHIISMEIRPGGTQVAGTLERQKLVMAAYETVDEIAKCFLGYEVKYVRRDDNAAADMLSNLGSGRKPIPPGIFLEHLRIPSVKGANPENPEVAVSPAKEESSHALKNRCDEQLELGLTNWTLSVEFANYP